MTAKEYLSRARHLQTRLDALERARSGAWERATSITPTSGLTVQGGDISRKTESYAELSTAIDAEHERLAKIKQEILDTVSKVQDNTLASLLVLYYVNGCTWEQTAVALNYSFRHTVAVLHPRALAEVDKIIQGKWRLLERHVGGG